MTEMAFKLTPKQDEANRVLSSEARHILLVGGARSGKTLIACRAIAIRAMRAEGSRHLIARLRANHVVASVWSDTWPKMMRLAFPDVTTKLDQQQHVVTFPNGSEVWFAGLDDRQRTEKILGLEFATVLLNELSQIPLSSRTLIQTRLAQNIGLKLRMIYDCNPPMAVHWGHRLFIEKRQASPPYAPLTNPQDYAWLSMNPRDNMENLPAEYLAELEQLPPAARLRFLEGRWGSAGDNVLWTFETLEANRSETYPDLQRIVIGCDPSGASGPEDTRSDHIGIVVCGIGLDGRAYVLEDASCKAGPAVWGNVVAQCYQRHDADACIVERNFGGAMASEVIRSAAVQNRMRINIKEVVASRGKVVRAEPISQLYQQGKVAHVGHFSMLEDELCSFTTSGFMGDRSPDRADALVWALSELFPRVLQQERNKRRAVEVVKEGCFGNGWRDGW